MNMVRVPFIRDAAWGRTPNRACLCSVERVEHSLSVLGCAFIVARWTNVPSNLLVLALAQHSEATADTSRVKSLRGLRVVDVGCGAGILAEPLARLGADVLGIDASDENIGVAIRHRDVDSAAFTHLQYRCCTSEQLVQEFEGAFDVVVTSEVAEHVSDPALLISSCIGLLRPGGTLIISTIDRTVKSLIGGIVAAEYILGLLEPGTHSWAKFLKPSEVEWLISRHGLSVDSVCGMHYDPLRNRWTLGDHAGMNYILSATKPTES